jgi:hypothetical protein
MSSTKAQVKALGGKQDFVKELYATIFGEASGGGADEIKAVTSAFLNRAATQGMEKALQGSSAYRKKSPQYTKAYSGDLTSFERGYYDSYKAIIDNLVANPSQRLPYTHFENVKVFGDPSWASSMGEYKDIGRQRFYRQKGA